MKWILLRYATPALPDDPTPALLDSCFDAPECLLHADLFPQVRFLLDPGRIRTRLHFLLQVLVEPDQIK